ncbi:hypothetical protein TRFO_26970 [Tritrichomonas foetus]|uniref:BTB domain-containing protein n=1 Tax=Tritrichomonas foetus TaxID=1144522 RepID=A0A1J4K7A0_9EUKA|nr:hypothetical protein TRFO_26970 [Tritrichomonas foetus]|eukprot:OHT05285.1 hypothetical protein TRFO_26970 [Tritrichomonas foetus]
MFFRERLQSNFELYRKNKTFCDCKIVLSDHEVLAHRLVLAKYSSFFLDLFMKTNEKGIYAFRPEFNPQDTLESVIDFLYTNQIDLDQSNLVAYLSVSKFYGIPILEEIVTEQFPQCTNKDTVLEFCRQCVEYNIPAQAKIFVPTVAENWSSYQINNIYSHIDPTILADVLNDSHLANLKQDAKLQIIDGFISLHPTTTNEQREQLATVIDWSHPAAYQYLVRHNCEWVPARIARQLMRRIMKERRYTFRKLQERVNFVPESSNNSISARAANDGEISRWFLFTWMISIHRADVIKDQYTIPIINFLSTYGGLSQGFDAVTTGAITVNSSEPMSKSIKPNYAFGCVKGEHFVSIGNAKLNPFYEIDFGQKAKLIPSSVSFKCSDKAQIEEKLGKMKEGASKKIDESTNLSPNPTEVLICGNGTDILYQGEFKDKIPLKCNDPINKLKFVMVGDNVAGNKILRLFGIEIYGEFIPE